MKKIIAANWKMNKTIAEAEEFCKCVKEITFSKEVIIFPSFVAIDTCSNILAKTDIAIIGFYSSKIDISLDESLITYVNDAGKDQIDFNPLGITIRAFYSKFMTYNKSDKIIDQLDKGNPIEALGIRRMDIHGPVEDRYFNIKSVYKGNHWQAGIKDITKHQLCRIVLGEIRDNNYKVTEDHKNKIEEYLRKD